VYNKEVKDIDLFCGVARAITKVKPELKPEIEDTGGGIICLKLKQDDKWILVGCDNGTINFGWYVDEHCMEEDEDSEKFCSLPVKACDDFNLVAISLLYGINEIGIYDLKDYHKKLS